MKHLTLKLAVMSAFGLVSAQALATGFVNLPAAGFAVGSDTTAYTLCNTTGNFGSGTPIKPTTLANNTCAVFPINELATPETGFSFIASASRPVVMNNIYTNNTNITVGTVTEYVWRKKTTSGGVDTYECIYGAKVVNNNNEYNLIEDGDQFFEVNDIARGGFTGLPVEVAYSTIPTVSEPVYRFGRTYTSVQHRASGFADLPLTTPAMNPVRSINGVNAWPTPSGEPTSTQQSATLNDAWVTGTTDVNYRDDDGSTSAASGMIYVKTTCSEAAPSANEDDGAIRLRQTFQELAGDGQTDNPFIEVQVKGFVPPGKTISPAHTDPY